MLLMSSTLQSSSASPRAVAEVRWFLANYALWILVFFALGVTQGLAFMVTSPDGSIPGWNGSPIAQLLGYGLLVVVFFPLVIGLPVLIGSLALWRLLARIVGRPRLTAYVVAAVVAGAMIVMTRDSPIESIVLLEVLPAFLYATVVRLPPQPDTIAL